MMPSYTPAEARVLEDHYIACAKREGIWGKGVPPKSLREMKGERKPFPTTLAGFKREQDYNARLKYVLSLIKLGHDNVTSIKKKTRAHDSTVRKYFRALRERKQIELVSVGQFGERYWKAKTP
jgi:hypothetical protein